MSFVIGALGAVAVFGLYALGVFTGWKLCKRFARPAPAERPPDRELRKMAAQQEAFRQLQNYSAEVAYNMGGAELGEDEDI